MTFVAFDVRGIPAPQGSKRAFVNRYSGKPALVESSKRVAPWRQDVREAAMKAMGNGLPLASPLLVDLEFRLPRPKGHFRTGRNASLLRDAAPQWPAGKPDIDKLARAVLDALKDVVWTDDAQVVSLAARKRWVLRGDGGPYTQPGVAITIQPLESLGP